MADVTDRYTRQIRKPQDSVLEQEELERKEALQPSGLPPEELEGVAAFREEFDARTQGMGGVAFTAGPVDAALVAIKSRAAARVEAAQATPEEKLGRAVADALVERGIVPEPPSPVAADEYAEDDLEPEEEVEAEDGLYGWLDESEGRWYKTDAAGNFLTDESSGKYATYAPGEFEPAEDQDEVEVEETDGDWAGVWDGKDTTP